MQELLLWRIGVEVLDREEVTLEARLAGGMLFVLSRLPWGFVILDFLLCVAMGLLVSRLGEEINIPTSRVGGRDQVLFSMWGGGLGTLASTWHGRLEHFSDFCPNARASCVAQRLMLGSEVGQGLTWMVRPTILFSLFFKIMYVPMMSSYFLWDTESSMSSFLYPSFSILSITRGSMSPLGGSLYGLRASL
ncbi:hypothetical protein HJG60_008732 [Phyllostomus discolor]|uniref:Uncharacterized protein n=1 Tax=Phyllostomus discolor TaxID=89673 RepID=A0A834DI29_9CHIR|nr:hypothetical protein HJG60_008732 [Phyllostomus discolor]